MKTNFNILIDTYLLSAMRVSPENCESGRRLRALAVPARGSPVCDGLITEVMSRFRQKKAKKKTFPPHPL